MLIESKGILESVYITALVGNLFVEPEPVSGMINVCGNRVMEKIF
jgi:hypothetical protein